MATVNATRNFFDLLDDHDDPTLDAPLEDEGGQGDDDTEEPIEGLTGQGDELVYGARSVNEPLSVSMGVPPPKNTNERGGSRFEAFFTSHGPSPSRQEERKNDPVSISLPAPSASSTRSLKYTRDELLGFYRADLPLPADFQAVDKVTLAEALAPVAFDHDSDERGKVSRRGGREARGRGGAEVRSERRMQKSEFGWGHDEEKRSKESIEEKDERGSRPEWRNKKESEFERNKDRMLAEIEAERKRLREEREREMEKLRDAHNADGRGVSVFDVTRNPAATSPSKPESAAAPASVVEKKDDIKAVLSASGPVPHPGGPQWLYKDPKGVERGPFSAQDMAKWLQHDFFTPDLLVKREGEGAFVPLATLCLRFQANPFTGMPLVMWCQGSLTKFQKALILIQQNHMQDAQQLEQMVKQARSESAPASSGPIFGPTISAQSTMHASSTPASSTPPHGSLASVQWYYKDPKGSEQGPFSSADMDKWLRHNFFKIDLLVRRKEEPNFMPLAMLFLRLGAHPFTGIPLVAWLNGPHSEFQKNFVQFVQNQQRQMHFIQAQSQQIEAMVRQAQTQPQSSSGGPIFGPPIKGGAPVPQSPSAPPQNNPAAYAAYQRAMQAHLQAYMQHQQMLAQSSQSQPQQVQADTQEKSEGTPVKAEETGKGQEKQQEKPQREPRKAKSAIAQSSNAVPPPATSDSSAPNDEKNLSVSTPPKRSQPSKVVNSPSAFESLWDLEFASPDHPAPATRAAPGSPLASKLSKQPSAPSGPVKTLREIQQEEHERFKAAAAAAQQREAPKPSLAPWSNQAVPSVNLMAIQHEEAKAAQERQRILKAAQAEQRKAMEEQAKVRSMPWGYGQSSSHTPTLAEIQAEEARVAAQRRAEQDRMRETVPVRMGGAPWGAPLGAKPLSFAEIQEQERQQRLAMEQQTPSRRSPAPVTGPAWGGARTGNSSFTGIQREEEERAKLKPQAAQAGQAELGFWDSIDAPASPTAPVSSKSSAFPSLGGEKSGKEEKKSVKPSATPAAISAQRQQQRQAQAAAPASRGGKKKRGQVVDPSMMGFQSDLSGRNVVSERTDPSKLQDD